jgi:hypothetical protein
MRAARVDAENFDATALIGAKVERALDERGLAGAVRADQRERLAGAHLEGDARERSEGSIALRQRGHAQCGGGAGCVTHAR